MTTQFDETSFFRAVDRRRVSENLSWRELGRQLGLSPSTFSRLSRGHRPEIETFVKLLAWLKMPAEAFMIGTPTDSAGEADALSIITAALRHDPNIQPEAIGPLEDIVRVAYNTFRRTSH